MIYFCTTNDLLNLSCIVYYDMLDEHKSSKTFYLMDNIQKLHSFDKYSILWQNLSLINLPLFL